MGFHAVALQTVCHHFPSLYTHAAGRVTGRVVRRRRCPRSRREANP